MERDKFSYRILIVEDNPGDYLLAVDYLEEHILTPQFAHARSYKEALYFLKEDKEAFDIILLDLSLPDKSKEGLIYGIEEISTLIPIIVLTGYSDLSFAVKSLSLGISDYLIKENITPTTLYKSIIYNIERFKFVKNLKDSEKRYSDLFHLSPIPKWVYDIESLKLLDANDAAIRHYGYSPKEFLGMTILDLTPEEDRQEFKASLEKSQNENSFPFQGIARHRNKKGDIIYADVRSSILIFDGKKSGLILANDVTERVLHTKLIEKQNEKLKEIAWLQSHVIRAPLSRMMGLINLIADDVLTAQEKKEYLQHVLKSAHELDNIVKDVVKKAKQINIDQHEV